MQYKLTYKIVFNAGHTHDQYSEVYIADSPIIALHKWENKRKEIADEFYVKYGKEKDYRPYKYYFKDMSVNGEVID